MLGRASAAHIKLLVVSAQTRWALVVIKSKKQRNYKSNFNNLILFNTNLIDLDIEH